MSPGLVKTVLLPAVVVTAAKVALVVGTLLVIINQGPAILDGSLTWKNIVQMALTYLVPYCVSTYSAVEVIRKPVVGSRQAPARNNQS